MLSQRSSQSDSYRIPKHQVSAEIALRGAEPEEVSVFLHPRAATHAGHERPSELLLNDEPFLTVAASDGAVRFIHKAAIAWMTVALELEMSGKGEVQAQVPLDQCTPIDLTLDDGRTFVGEVAIMLPQGRGRLQDFLNASDRFFEVRSASAAHFVNRDRVVMVRATE